MIHLMKRILSIKILAAGQTIRISAGIMVCQVYVRLPVMIRYVKDCQKLGRNNMRSY